MKDSNIYEQPSFQTEVDSGWREFHDIIDPFVFDEKPEEFSVEHAKTMLMEHETVEDPRILWLQRSGIFNYLKTAPAAQEALSDDLENGGQWVKLFNTVCEKPTKELLDYVFISSFGAAVNRIASAALLIEENRNIIEGSRHITFLFRFQSSTRARFVTRHYADVDQAAALLQLDDDEILYYKGIVAKRVIDSFLQHDLYLDRGRCKGNSIDVQRAEYFEWIPALRGAITLLSQGDDAESQQYIEPIVEKLIDELAPELTDAQTGMDRDYNDVPNFYYDGHIRRAVIQMLVNMGMDVDARKEVYDKISGFLQLPIVGQIIPSNGHFNMQYIESEFAQHGCRRDLETDGLFVSSRSDTERYDRSPMAEKDLDELGATFYTAQELVGMGVNLQKLEYELWYGKNMSQLVEADIFDWDIHRPVLAKKDMNGITAIALLPAEQSG